MKLSKKILVTVALAFLTAIPVIKAAKLTPNKDQIVLNKNNTVSINDVVSPESVSDWTLKVKELDNKGPVNEPIYLVMNTPGGSIEAGIDFIEATKGMHRPVKTITVFAASMGFQIFKIWANELSLKTESL